MSQKNDISIYEPEFKPESVRSDFDWDLFWSLRGEKGVSDEQMEQAVSFFSQHQQDYFHAFYLTYLKELKEGGVDPYINKDDLSSICHQLNLEFEYATILKIDYKGTGKFNFNMFLQYIFAIKPTYINDSGIDKMQDIYNLLEIDKEGQAELSKETLKQWFKMCAVNDVDLDLIFDQFDIKTDYITKDQFIHIMTRFDKNNSIESN